MTTHARSIAILRLACPIIIAQLGSILQGWADTIMVGQYGTPELSAAGFVNNVFNLCLYFLLGISYATTPVVAAFFSQGKHREVLRSFHESNLVNLLMSLVVMALLFILYLNIHHLGQPDELLPLIRPYFIILLLSLPFLALFNSMKQYFDALGNTKAPMWVMIGSNILNFVLNYLLIFVLDLGLFGAGLATFISRAFMPLAMWLVLQHRQKTIGNGQRVLPNRQGILNLIRLGIPISVQLCLEAGSFNICVLFMGWIGAAALAAHQIMGTVCTLAFMVIYGIGAAAAIRIAHHRGIGNWEEVRRTAQTAVCLSFMIDAFIVAAICLASHPITRLFTTSHEVTVLVISFLPAFVCYQIGDCIQIIYANALRAIEDVRAMMFYAFVAYIMVSIPLAYLFAFPLHMGAVGIWWSFPFGLTTAGICYYLQFRRHMRKGGKGCNMIVS